jgi:hypothetical protein
LSDLVIVMSFVFEIPTFFQHPRLCMAHNNHRNAINFDLLFCLSPGPFMQPISVSFLFSLRWAMRTLLCINTRRFLMVDSPFSSFLFLHNQLIFLVLSPHFSLPFSLHCLPKCLVGALEYVGFSWLRPRRKKKGSGSSSLLR